MPVLVGTIDRIDQTTGNLIALDVVLLDVKHAHDVSNAWRSDPTAGSPNGADFYWTAVSRFWPQRQLLAVMNQKIAYAMMQLDEEYAPAPKAVYISFLEVAPAERTGAWSRKFTGLGTSLVRFAIVRSQQLGFYGRVGLHSTSRAQAFYDKLGFKEIDDPGPNEYWEKYLELSPDRAKVFMDDNVGGPT